MVSPSQITSFCHHLTLYVARSSVLAVMEKAITRGHLTVADSEGVHHFGTRSKGSNDVYLKVVNDDFWMRILLSQDLGCEYIIDHS